MSSPRSTARHWTEPIPLVPQYDPHGLGAMVPRPLTSLVGREREVAAIGDRFRHEGDRLLTLTGPGGGGKTRLALAVATALIGDFADGVGFVSLAPITDSRLVPAAIAQALGIRENGTASLPEQLGALLGRREMLLVLDNFERLTDAAPYLTSLLSDSPGLRMLVTSRSALQVTGERVFLVPPLPEGAAVQLFVERARAINADFVLGETNISAVTEVCRRLDGLPLAIELAAARVDVLPPEAMLPRLAQRLPLLTKGRRDQPTRLQTMWHAIAWSHDLLSPEDQAFFRRLAVFAGGFTLEAVAAVSDDHNQDVLTGVANLVDQSLLRSVEGPGGDARYDMMETIREFGVEHLRNHDELTAVRDAHADYYVALAERAEPELTRPQQAVWLDRLEMDLANVRAALDWLRDRGRIEQSLRLVAALTGLWFYRGHLSEARARLEELLALPGADGTAMRAKALTEAGTLAMWQGDDVRTTALQEEALVAFQALGDQSGVARCLRRLSNAVINRGDHVRAEALAQESLAIYRELDDPHGVTLCIYLGGLAALGARDAATATARLSEAAALARDGDDPSLLATILGDLGFAAMAQRDFALAAQRYAEQLTLSHELSDKDGIAWGLEGVAMLIGNQGQAGRSVALLGAAAALREELGVPVPSIARSAYDRAVLNAHQELGEQGFSAHWDAGRIISTSEAVAEALSLAASPNSESVGPQPAADHGLTPRELDVLRLIVDGRTNKEIANELFISHRTVTTHVTNILNKLGLDSRTAVGAYAVRHSIT